MWTLLQDVRFSLRMLAKNPGFTVVAIITLALGIGANSTIFSWINSTVLDSVPGVRNTSDMVTVMRGERSEHPTPPFSFQDYIDLREDARGFSGLLAYHDDYVSLTGGEKPERIYGALTSANYFNVLGVRPILGRAFLPEEEQKIGGAAVVVISYGLWQRRFGADRSVIGTTIQINLHPYTIVGVAPPDFQGCKSGLKADLWIPLVMDREIWGSKRLEERGTFWLNVLGKLRPGANRRQAEKELDLAMQRIAERFPDSHRGPNQITLDPLWRSPFGANVYLYSTLPLLLAFAGVLLLVACANVANLLLVRSITRRREIAIRLSMGASRWRVVRQFLVESLALALGACLVAILITSWTAGTFAAFFPPTTLPLTINGRADGFVLLATLAVSILTAAIFGTLPALRASLLNPVAVLKEEGGSVSGTLGKARLSSALVVAQIALSLVLLISAGLFVRSLRNAQLLDPGFDPNHVLIASYDLEPAGYSEAQGNAFDRQLLAKLNAIPGVESATLADFSPLNFTIHTDYVNPEGYVPQPHESMEVDRGVVGPNYFHTMRTALLEGRDFTDQDNENSQPVMIVNQEFVDRYWPHQDALGKRVKLWGQWLTVVGVAQNAKYRRVLYNPAPGVFLPLFQDYYDYVFIHARVSGDPKAFALPVENSVHELNPDLPVFDVMPLRKSMELGNVFERLAGTFVGSFGLLALVLAAVGIYGVVAYTTRLRTREIGIRIALGARRGDVFRLVLSQGIRLTCLGLAIGLAASLAVTRVLRSELLGVTPTDFWTYASVSLLLCAVSLAACYIPARRATKVNPMVALRFE
jgi:putative ABC transport system permease protein